MRDIAQCYRAKLLRTAFSNASANAIFESYLLQKFCPSEIGERQVAQKQRPSGVFERLIAPKQRLRSIFERNVAQRQRPSSFFERHAARSSAGAPGRHFRVPSGAEARRRRVSSSICMFSRIALRLRKCYGVFSDAELPLAAQAGKRVASGSSASERAL